MWYLGVVGVGSVVVCACVCVRMYVCVCACVHTCVCVECLCVIPMTKLATNLHDHIFIFSPQSVESLILSAIVISLTAKTLSRKMLTPTAEPSNGKVYFPSVPSLSVDCDSVFK